MRRLTRPRAVAGQRVSALRFDAERVTLLLSALGIFRRLPYGLTKRDLREQLAPLLGQDARTLTSGRMTQDLRRLRLHGLIERVPGTHRYRTTDLGLRRALFFTRAYARLVRAGLSQLRAPGGNSALRTAFCRLERAMDSFCEGAKLAA